MGNVALNAGRLLTGLYAFQLADLANKAVYTNTMPTGAYCDAGRPEAAYYIEPIVSALADELGLDPVVVRRKNFISPKAFPYQNLWPLTSTAIRSRHTEGQITRGSR